MVYLYVDHSYGLLCYAADHADSNNSINVCKRLAGDEQKI